MMRKAKTEVTSDIMLKGSADLGRRIELLAALYTKAEEKVNHSDMFRQRNMNYSMVIFGALMTVGIKLDDLLSRAIVSGTLFALTVIFCFWDRRWHKTKHGWDYSSSIYYKKMEEMVNEPNNDITYKLYYVEGERSAEWFSFQPVVFYFLIIASLTSFFLFSLLKVMP
ncbi:MAG: hypothetical protein FD156_1143 [Nitrospirae bacterium]|nr:MAG: hypothetical protein FD156_1143 [Nitrospirota bacterium]